ncbi:MAG: lysylphosphatidylglycerol synthase transmembrane domain-containing protein [Methanomicrobiales archaeon]|jgi:hypothetical protein|nr:lysylphosphatidylglycerol synthase transmembrane domain-containing protein [Methanomicrobiales archaeon]
MWRKVSSIAVPVILAVGIIFAMLWWVKDDIAAALFHLNPIFLIPAALISAGVWWIRGWRYRVILAGMAISVTTIFSTALIFISQTANLIVPARLGDLVRVFILREEGLAGYSEGIASIIVERVFDILTVAVLGLITLTLALTVPSWFLPAIVLPIVIIAVFFGVLLIWGNVRSENRYANLLLTMVSQMRSASLSPRSLVLLSTSSLLIWLLDSLICAFTGLMFGQEIPFSAIVLAIVIGNLVKAIPITPGGVGTYELAVALTLQSVGVPAGAATLIAVFDHLIKNLATIVGGIASIYFLGSGRIISIVKSALSKRTGGGGGTGN